MDALQNGNRYALSLSPGFFGFYAHIGALHALEENDCLNVSHVSGSSAGALVGGYLAAGLSPSAMIASVVGVERQHMWDLGGFGGLLKGKLFNELVVDTLPVQSFAECRIPFCATAYDVLRFRTNCITEGSLAQAMCASCCFPGLFQPVIINSSPHIDGGVWDHVGLMGLPHAVKKPHHHRHHHRHHHHHHHRHNAAAADDDEDGGKAYSKEHKKHASHKNKKKDGSGVDGTEGEEIAGGRRGIRWDPSVLSPSPADQQQQEDEPTVEHPRLVVNVVFDKASVRSSKLPDEHAFRGAKLLTIVLEDCPAVSPFSMSTAGPVAYSQTRAAVHHAIIKCSPNNSDISAIGGEDGGNTEEEEDELCQVVNLGEHHTVVFVNVGKSAHLVQEHHIPTSSSSSSNSGSSSNSNSSNNNSAGANNAMATMASWREEGEVDQEEVDNETEEERGNPAIAPAVAFAATGDYTSGLVSILKSTPQKKIKICPSPSPAKPFSSRVVITNTTKNTIIPVPSGMSDSDGEGESDARGQRPKSSTAGRKCTPYKRQRPPLPPSSSSSASSSTGSSCSNTSVGAKKRRQNQQQRGEEEQQQQDKDEVEEQEREERENALLVPGTPTRSSKRLRMKLSAIGE